MGYKNTKESPTGMNIPHGQFSGKFRYAWRWDRKTKRVGASFHTAYRGLLGDDGGELLKMQCKK
jgi:hypothetical protein